MKTKDYPRWCCWECGIKHGTKKDRIASWHFGKCDVCEKNNNVTEPRDFGHFRNWFTPTKNDKNVQKMRNKVPRRRLAGLRRPSDAKKVLPKL